MAVPAAPAYLRILAGCTPVGPANTVLQVTVEWEAVSGATNYRLERFNGASWVLAVNTTSLTHFHQIGAGYVPGTSENWRVRAENADGQSAYVTLTYTRPGRPASLAEISGPSGLTFTSITADVVKVTWTDNDLDDSGWLFTVTDSEGVVTTYSQLGFLNSYSFVQLRPGEDYTITLQAVVALADGSVVHTPATEPQTITVPPIATVVSIPDDVVIEKDLPMKLSGVIYNISGAPTLSLVRGPLGIGVLYLGESGGVHNFRIEGTPTEEGIFDALLSIDVTNQIFYTPVRFLVSGDNVIAPMHADPLARDIRIDTRTGEVSGYYMTVQEGLKLRLGDDAQLYLFFRDGKKPVRDGFTEVSLKVRFPGQSQSPALLLETLDAPVVAMFGSAPAFGMALRVEGDALRRYFELAVPEGNGANELLLEADAQVTWTRMGKVRTSEVFKVTFGEELLGG